MVTVVELSEYLDTLMDVKNFKDYCPNGLQVAGKRNIQTLVTAVTSCLSVINSAIELKADAILVHHGLFWNNTEMRIDGMLHARLYPLMTSKMNLLAYHLPLDAHTQYGNNIQLAHKLGILSPTPHPSNNIIFTGVLSEPMRAMDFANLVETVLQRTPTMIANHPNQPIAKIAWCTGGAQKYFETVQPMGVDAYITGEISEHNVHFARENGMCFFACGHHATERYGVQALGAHLSNRFNLNHHYIEIDNPA